MKTKILILLAFLIVLNTCKDGITNPPEPDPGRRDYVWTVDTINPGQESLYLGRIWGGSPKDVWAVGSSSWSATSIWHYNGVQWRCDSIPRKVNPTAVFGISNKEVWLGNSNSTIWKHNGSQWMQFNEYKVEGYDRVCINYIDGFSSVNIFGVGFIDKYNSNIYKSIIMHYDGYNWKFVNIPEIKVSFEKVTVDPQNGVLIMSGTVYDPTGFVAKIYCWDGKELKELISGYGNTFITKLGDEIYATHNTKIFKYSDKQLTLWKDNSGTEINGNIICGRSKNDFFIGAIDGIAHFNGTDFNIIYKKTPGNNVEVGIGIIFEKDVFFIAVDLTLGKNFIIHGILK